MSAEIELDAQVLLDGLGEAVLIFDSAGKLIKENLAARALFSSDMTLLRAEGWKAAAILFNAGLAVGEETMDIVREKALQSERPVRFHIYRSGEYIPCWASAVQAEGGAVYLMITLENPDWHVVSKLIDRFRDELRTAVDDTRGHINLINKTLNNLRKEDSAQDVSKRIGNFIQLINIHMSRTARFMEMFSRMEDIRTSKVREMLKEDRKKIELETYFEDFLEELDEIELIDPESEARDYRSQVTTDIPEGIAISASSRYFTRILRDVLANAIMYSLRGTPIKIAAQTKNQNVQIDVVDEGYGVRQKEIDRVFAPFQRSRQPQIISEFGYGLSLYLCKHEIEAMGGRMWFSSEEGVGSTFSLMLPSWRDSSGSESDSKP